MKYNFYRPYKVKFYITIGGKVGQRKDGYHYGVDYAGIKDKTIYSITNGKVIRTGYQAKGAGNFVVINSFDYPNIEIKFFHLSKIYVSVTQHIDPNTAIGVEGSTGRSSGSHLHLEIWDKYKIVNPEKNVNWIKRPYISKIKDENNFIKYSAMATLGFLGYLLFIKKK